MVTSTGLAYSGHHEDLSLVSNFPNPERNAATLKLQLKRQTQEI